MRRLAAVAAVAALALSLRASPARAFVRSTTDQGTAVFWVSDCTFMVPDDTPPPDMSLDQFVATLTQSIANWQGVTLDVGCSYLKMNLDPTAPVEARLDNVNIAKFRTDRWCRPADPSKGQAEMCYSPQAAAITTVFYVSKKGDGDDGKILDADIELNAINFSFVHIPTPAGYVPRDGTSASDLENTLTHELGHFQGLDHTCWDHATARQPVDESGVPIPDCADVEAHNVPEAEYQKVVQSVMFPFSTPSETIKRTPKADDIAAICGIYPAAKDPRSCSRPGGCAIAAPTENPPLAALLLLLGASLLLLARRATTARTCTRARRP